MNFTIFLKPILFQAVLLLLFLPLQALLFGKHTSAIILPIQPVLVGKLDGALLTVLLLKIRR